MLVPHRSGFRRAWMFPRNIRAIPPWKVMQILTILMDLTKGWSWSGNVETQKAFTKALEGLNLKTTGQQRDANSGGARTYWAQLEGLGLVFTKDDDNSIWPTIAGKTLLEEKQPLLVLQTQLLRYQYPSPYGAGQNVKIHPEIKIHPFQFLLELINDADLDGLLNVEFVIPVVYGHNQDCFEICKEKILAWRASGGSGLDQVDSWEEDLSTPRTEGKRSAESAWEDLKNVGNTFKNALESNNLIALDVGSNRFVLGPEAELLLESERRNRDRFIPLNGNQNFQQTFGRFDRIKDTRRLIAGIDDTPLEAGSSIILSHFFAYCGTSVPNGNHTEWAVEMNRVFGFGLDKIEKVVEPYLDRALSIFEATYIDLSHGGKSAGLDFEEATAQLFRTNLAFNVTRTGQRKRSGVGNFSDLLLIPIDPQVCAIVDTKASARYTLDSGDYLAMANNYIPHYDQLELARGKKLEFCAYVAGGFGGQYLSKLSSMRQETGIPISAITARDLLRLAQRNPGQSRQAQLRAAFSKGGQVLESTVFPLG